MLMPISGRRDMKVTLSYNGPIKAPVAAGQEIGTLTVSVPGKARQDRARRRRRSGAARAASSTT